MYKYAANLKQGFVRGEEYFYDGDEALISDGPNGNVLITECIQKRGYSMSQNPWKGCTSSA